MKRRLYEIFIDPPEWDRLGAGFSAFILTLIAVNVFVGILESVESLGRAYPAFFYYFEVISVAIFSVEYLLRLYACTASEDYADPLRGRVRWVLKPLVVVDALAILPFYLQAFIPGFDLRFVRVLRLFRLFRIFRVGKLAEALQLFLNVARGRRDELLVSFVIVVIVVVFSSSVMYIVEHETQKEQFSSIPAAMWWGIITVTTIGYGDIYPVTPLGRFIGAVLAFLGICILALPIGILGTGFIEEIERKKAALQTPAPAAGDPAVLQCPHCGRDIRMGDHNA